MERVTVQFNGEMVTLDVPEGMTDDQIIAFLQQQQTKQPPAITQAPASLQEPVTQQVAMSAIKPATQIAASQAEDLLKLGKIAGQITPKIAGEFLSTPIKSVKDLASAYSAGHPMASTIGNMPLKSMPGAVARAAGTALMAPENILMAPYTMAGYEMEKIRANPTAPEYEYNPYAQTVRGQAPTMGAAGAANRRQALRNMPYGNLTAEEQTVLNNQAQPQVPQEPTAENFIERMKRLAQQYGPVAFR